MKTIFLLCLLITWQMVTAQSTSLPVYPQHRSLGVEIGFNQLRLLDRNTSSLVYRGNIPTLGFFYEGTKNGNSFLSSLRFGRGSFFSEAYPDRIIKFRNQDAHGHVDSVSVPMRGTNTLAQLSLGYLRQIGQGHDLQPSVGAIISDDLYYPQGFVQPGLMNLASLSPALQLNYVPAERHFFSLRIQVPLVNLVSRSTYNNSVSQPVDGKAVGFFDQGTAWRTPVKHRQIDLSAGWSMRLGDHFRSGLQYRLRLLKNTAPRDLTIAQNELSLRLQMAR